MRFRKFLLISTFALLILAVFGLKPHPSIAQNVEGTASPEAATASPVPTSQPLILLWQTGGSRDDRLPDANFIAVDNQGNCYVTTGTNDVVKKFDTNGKFVAEWGEYGTGDGQFDFQTGIAVDAQGNVFISDFLNTRVQKFDSAGKFLAKWATEAPVGPTGIGVDMQGNVYVANHRPHDHHIQKFDSTGRLLSAWGPTGTDDGQFAPSGPQQLAVDKQGNVYVTDRGNHRIQKFDSNGKFLAKFGPFRDSKGQDLYPSGVAVDTQGNIYIEAWNSYEPYFVQKLDPNGNFLAQWTAVGGDLDQTGFIAVDGQGDIYIIANADVTYPSGLKLNTAVLKKFRQP